MLQNIRYFSKTWVAKIIFSLVAFSFIFFGFGSFNFISNQKNDLVKVNGDVISRLDLDRQIAFEKQRFNEIFQGMSEEEAQPFIDNFINPSNILENLIDRLLLDQWVYSLGLGISKDQIIEKIKDIPGIMNELGEFDDSIFLQLSNRLGYSPEKFLDILRKDLLVHSVITDLTDTTFVSEVSINRYTDLLSYEREVFFVSIPKQSIEVVTTEDEIFSVYSNDKNRWFSNEKMDVEFVLLDQDLMQVDLETISDADISDLYEKKLSELSSSKRVYHLQVSKTDLNKIEDIRAKIALKKLSFFDAVSLHSIDLSSSEKKGYIGNISETESLFDESLQKVAQALPYSEISSVVETSYGYHLLFALPEENFLNFDKLELKKELALSRRIEMFDDKKQELEEALSFYDDFDDFSESLNLSRKSFDNLDIDTKNPLFSSAIINQLFSSESFKEGYYEKIVLDNGNILVVSLQKFHPSVKNPYEKVKSEVTELLLTQKRKKTQSDLIKELSEHYQSTKIFKSIQDVLLKYNISSKVQVEFVSSIRDESVFSEDLLERIYSDSLNNKELNFNEERDQLVVYLVSDIKKIELVSIDQQKIEAIKNRYIEQMNLLSSKNILKSLRSNASITYLN